MSTIIETLRQISLFGKLTDDQLGWIAGQGREVFLKPNERIATEGDPADGFYIILDGEIEWTKKVGRQDVHAVTLGAGTIFAELILILDAPYPTTGRALTDVRLFKLEPDAFWDMLKICPSVLRGVVKIAAERAQIHESVSQQHAKLMSLGTMAAGLAHELNNPAAAANRAAGLLRESFDSLPKQVYHVIKSQLTREQWERLSGFLRDAEERARALPPLSPIDQSDRESELSDWLDDRGVAESWEQAPALVQAGVTPDELDTLAEEMPDGALSDIVAWAAANLTTNALLNELEESNRRISTLVKAVKDYAFLDKAPLQEIDLHTGLDNTLIILKYKLQKGNITINRAYDTGLPHICAYGSELNQVWTNLLDNAVDAVGANGEITIRTAQEPDRVLVEITDNGPGIPLDIQGRIFEPFFTTKEVGKGTGLGLDITRRIVDRHKGSIRFESKPGETRFQVRLPIGG
jgi:signal transduction histidine kinase